MRYVLLLLAAALLSGCADRPAPWASTALPAAAPVDSGGAEFGALRRELAEAQTALRRARAAADRSDARADALAHDNDRLAHENAELKRRLKALGEIESTLSERSAAP